NRREGRAHRRSGRDRAGRSRGPARALRRSHLRAAIVQDRERHQGLRGLPQAEGVNRVHEGAGPDWLRRAFAAGGGVCCALAIAWAAYAAHALDPALRSRADSATLMLLAHGLALAVFAPRQRSRLELAALSGWAF